MNDSQNKSKAQVRVWDLPTRAYHWAQLILVASALILGFFGPEWWLDAHVLVGYGVLALIVFRFVWGFWGPQYSRFSSFIFSPHDILTHIRGIARGKPSHFLGHNPLGAVMVFALIFVLALLSASGLTALGGVENQGPLAGFVNFDLGAVAQFTHEFLAYLLVGMIGAHIVGVLVESRISRISLTVAMIDGKKPLGDTSTPAPLNPSRKTGALVAVLGAGILVIGAGVLLSAIPPSGVIPMPGNDRFQTECADCHEVYHPSLMPRASWTLLMADLGDHFGEDASLSADVNAEITTYLNRYAAQAWDTEPANMFGEVDEKHPFQITATPFWLRTHADIPKSIFETKPVNGKANCAACHKDAVGGMFADQNIQIAHGQN